MRRSALFCLGFAALGLASGCAAPVTLLRGQVVTLDPARPRAQALAVRGGRVVAVGSLAEVRAAVHGLPVREVDHGDATILPGLGDAHGHVASLGRKLASLDLGGVRSEAELVAKVAEHARGRAAGEWIYGRGWDQTRWPGGEFPTNAALSAAVAQPVVLGRVDGHASLVSAAALRAAGLSARTADPPGGRILRDGRGEPTGVLIDNAMALVRPPPLSRAERLAHLRSAVAYLAGLGFTQVHDLGTEPETLALLRELAAQGELPLRIVVYRWAGDERELVAALATPPEPSLRPGWRVLVRGIKLVADGAMGSRGAALLAPYADEPAGRGQLLWSEEALHGAIARIDARGYQPAVHAIGDRAVAAVLSAFQSLPRRSLPPRLEHLQLLPENGLLLVSTLVHKAMSSEKTKKVDSGGLIASMQPSHLASDQRWVVQRLGVERAARAYRWRAALDAGAVLAFGSDFPVEEPDPRHGLHAAVTRGARDGTPAPFGSHEPLSALEALTAFTSGVAAAAGLPRVGRIAVGSVADFSVFDTDLSRASPTALLRAKAICTYIDGVSFSSVQRHRRSQHLD